MFPTFPANIAKCKQYQLYTMDEDDIIVALCNMETVFFIVVQKCITEFFNLSFTQKQLFFPWHFLCFQKHTCLLMML
jgi:hypothetical protein